MDQAALLTTTLICLVTIVTISDLAEAQIKASIYVSIRRNKTLSLECSSDGQPVRVVNWVSNHNKNYSKENVTI